MKTKSILLLTLLSLLLFSFSNIKSSQEKDDLEKNIINIKECDCVTIYYSHSGYGKLKQFTKTTKNTTKQGCLKKHKQITKFSGRTETQVPYSKFCGEVIIKG